MHNNIVITTTALLLTVLMAGGCTMAPKYHRPEAPIPVTYGQTASSENAALPQWQQFFADPVMQRLIGIALESNRDYRVSLLNIEKTRAQYQIQRADLLPTVATAAAGDSQHLPSEFTGTGKEAVVRQYSATLGFSAFELDLFGRVRSLTEGALKMYHSVEIRLCFSHDSLPSQTWRGNPHEQYNS